MKDRTFTIAILLLAGAIFKFPAAPAQPAVPAADRLLQAGDIRGAGEVLLGELGCVACHDPPPDFHERALLAQPPHLQDAAARLTPRFAARFLADPQSAQPGAKMPNLFSALPPPERDEAIASITHFLGALAASVPLPSSNPAHGSADAGQALFHTVGCVACHPPDPSFQPRSDSTPAPSEPPVAPSTALSHLPQKFQRGALARFLQNPLAARPDGRMPNFHLTPEEAGRLEAYLLALPASGNPASAIWPADPALAELGARWAEKLNCRACHSFGSDHDRRKPQPKAPPLAALKAGISAGCWSAHAHAGRPRYALHERHQQALLLALQHIHQSPPPSPALLLNRRLTTLQCLACHERDGQGGPDGSRQRYFVSSSEDSGDEGRLPPTLTGVGGKLTAAALLANLRGQGRVRPYLAARMPDFGETHARELTRAFELADHNPNLKPTPRVSDPVAVGRNVWGRELLGNTGLNCIACHLVRGRGTPGMQTLDLAHAPGRLRPEWFRDYLLDPARYRPGTRMPSFWPEGKPLLKGFGGTADRQIDSIWVYLQELDQSRWPAGLEERGQFEIKVEDRPVVFRTFMPIAGLHAIAVGFPEQIHAAFDSQNLAWALAWKGKFLDAENTWDNRFNPLTPPLGESVLELPPGPCFAWLNHPEDPWPDETSSPSELAFDGYRLNSSGYPAFFYRFQHLRLADTITPFSESGPKPEFGLRRVLAISSGTAANSRETKRGTPDQPALWFRAAVSRRGLERFGSGFWIDGKWEMRLPGSHPFLRNEAAQLELIVPISLQTGQAAVIQEIRW